MYVVRVVVCGVEVVKELLCCVLFIYAARRDFGGEDGSELTIMCCKCVYI